MPTFNRVYVIFCRTTCNCEHGNADCLAVAKLVYDAVGMYANNVPRGKVILQVGLLDIDWADGEH